MTRFQLLLVVLLACGLVVAGCGGDDDEQTDAPAATETAPPDTAPADTTGAAEEEETDTGGDAPAFSEENREACEQALAAATQLPEETQDRLEELCEEGAAGNEEAVREASIEICKEFAENNIPEGSAREEALEQCERAGEQ